MKKSRLMLTGLSLMLAFVLAACGGDDEPTPMPTPTALPAVEVATTAPTPTDDPTEVPETVQAEQPVSPLQPESPLQAESPLPTPTPAPEAYEAETNEGLAQVRGRVVNSLTGEPIAHTYIRLAELYCAPDVDPNEKQERCIWGLDDAQSPFAETDDDGNFVFDDVIPGDFVFFIGNYTIKDGYAIALGDDNIALIYSPVADEGLDIGEVKVIYPPIPSDE